MIEYRTASIQDLYLMLDWAAEEGWNPGSDDAAAFHAADPKGFFLALDDSAPVAAISVVNHSDTFAFLGLYIALPSHRRKGIGLGLWRHAIKHAGDRTIGLDGVPDQQANYAASDFVLSGKTTRFWGNINPSKAQRVRLSRPEDIPAIINQVTAVSGVNMQAYLTAWFQGSADRQTLIDPEGICTVRRCRSSAKIGPLIAENEKAALRLIHQASHLMGPGLMLDVPESSPDLLRLCQNLGLKAGFETARMYRGVPPVAKKAIYAVTSLELG